jgi:hypothetical protein
MLRERVVGHEVFGRPAAYDPGDDPVVRIRAADVRKRLAIYYQAHTSTPTVKVEIPSGSYRAVFTFAEIGSAKLAIPVPSSVVVKDDKEAAALTTPIESQDMGRLPSQEQLVSTHRPFLWRWVVAALLVLVASSAAYVSVTGRDQRALAAMWGPFLKRGTPVLLSVGSNAVYRVSETVADTYGKTHHLEGQGMEFFPDFSPQQTLASTGLQPAPASFVAEGDLSAVADAVTVLTSLHQPVQERFTNNISFAEVQSSPSVLIGGFNNPMSIEFGRSLRYAMTSRTQIQDRKIAGKVWVLSAPRDARETQDYAIVTRLISGDQAPLLEVAGLGQYGTLAAMHFVCAPDAIRSLSRVAGADWTHRNLQLVLKIRVVDYRPAGTEIVASSSW